MVTEGETSGKMFPSNPQILNYSKPLAIQDIEAVNHVAPNESSSVASSQVSYGVAGYEERFLVDSKRLQDELVKHGSKIKEHEDNLKILKAQRNQLDDSIVDLQVRLVRHQSSSSVEMEVDESPDARSDKKIIEQIMKNEKSAAGILCQLQAHQGFQNFSSMLTQDVIGIVATLCQVDEDNLSRLLSEYLGLETMLAIVCKSYDGVKALEVYDNEGHINEHAGIHGLGASTGKPLLGRFHVICLENLRPYGGNFITDDPQKRLDITKPKLLNGDIPAGFLGFAVNMIKVDENYLNFLTASGCGIRETLFYNLFSQLQIYRTRADMLHALPCISDGAISLDGGMIRNNGIFSLGRREDVDLRFPNASKALDVPMEYIEIEKQMKRLEQERERLNEDACREQSVLVQAKLRFQKKKLEFSKFLADSSKHISQMQPKIVTVCFGGEWKMKDAYSAYVGNFISKAFVIQDSFQLDVVKQMIMDRFNIDSTTQDISLAHLHPFRKMEIPYTVDKDEDLKSFIDISEAPEVSWTLPLYVSASKKMNGSDLTTVAQENNVVTLQPDDYFRGAYVEDTTNRENNEVTLQSVKETNIEEYDDGDQDDCLRYHEKEGNDFLFMGQLFKSKFELKNAVSTMAVRQNFGFRVKKSTPERYKVICVNAECTWKIVATRLKNSNSFEIRKISHDHTCSFEIRCAQHRQPSYQAVAEMIKRRYEGVTEGPNPKEIRSAMQKEFHQNVSYWKSWRAQELAQNLIRGTPEENYSMLPSYCQMLRQVNPGTYTCIEMGDSNRFKCVFISFGASIRGFHLLRKVVMIDVTFLHGKYRGSFIVAAGQDANKHVYPLAFAVVDSENDDSWKWFFQKLADVIPFSDDLVFVSDQNSSIDKAIESVYSSAGHVICTRHLERKLREKYKDRGVHHLFTQASECYTIREFEVYFDSICSRNEDMGQYLRDANFQKWSQAHFPGDRYNIMTTNTVECIDSLLKEARSYPIVALFDHIRETLSRWFKERREKAEKNKELPPVVKDILQARADRSGRYEVKVLNDIQFEVTGGQFFGVVDLSQKTCSCRVFDLDHIPCAHAIAAIQHTKFNMTDFVSDYYKIHSWSMAYHETIYPVPCKSDWVVPEDVIEIPCHPPIVCKKTGRPRICRTPLVAELQKKTKKKINKCSTCGKLGHNKSTCPSKSSDSTSLLG